MFYRNTLMIFCLPLISRVSKLLTHSYRAIYFRHTPAAYQTLVERKRTSSASWEECRTYMTVYMCWSSAMFGQQIDFACGNTTMGAKCIFAASFSYTSLGIFLSLSPQCEKKWARKNNKKVITYLIIFSLGMLLHLLLLLIGFADLSPINNDNNHQRQAQVANTIAHQPISMLRRYDWFLHNHWSLLKMRSIWSQTRE